MHLLLKIQWLKKDFSLTTTYNLWVIITHFISFLSLFPSHLLSVSLSTFFSFHHYSLFHSLIHLLFFLLFFPLFDILLDYFIAVAKSKETDQWMDVQHQHHHLNVPTTVDKKKTRRWAVLVLAQNWCRSTR